MHHSLLYAPPIGPTHPLSSTLLCLTIIHQLEEALGCAVTVTRVEVGLRISVHLDTEDRAFATAAMMEAVLKAQRAVRPYSLN